MCIPDYRKAIKKLFDVLKPGGEIGVTINTESRMADFITNLIKHPKWGFYLQGEQAPYADFSGNRGPEPGETMLRKALVDAGFVIDEIRTQERPQIEDPSTLAGICKVA